MSIIDKKYRDKYRGDKDFIAQMIEDQCMAQATKVVDIKDEDGNVTGKKTVNDGKPKIALDALFDLADANGFDSRKKYGDQVDRKNAAGRLRMTIGNMLRAASKRRGGLVDIDGDWHPAPGYVGEPIENRDGSKIAKSKPATAAAPAA